MSTKHTIERVRHDLVRRVVTVAEVEQVTPRMRRLHFESSELAGFQSPSPDDHIGIFVPSSPGQEVIRHYTPRSFDATRQRLAIDFALHDAGPATRWAENAQIGDSLPIGGPRGSLLVADDFDWYLLIGDETALPAIGRRVETLRARVPVLTVATIFDQDEAQRFTTRAAWEASWVARGAPSPDDAERLRAAVAGLRLPSGDGFVWIGGEASIARSLRALLIERGHPRAWIHASGYWKRGVANAHEVVGDA